MLSTEINEHIQKWESRWDNVVLDLLIMDHICKEPKYGGELVEFAKLQISPNIKIPTVYFILKRGITNGIILVEESKGKDKITRGTKRKYYSITEVGIQYLNKIKISVRGSLPLLYSILEK